MSDVALLRSLREGGAYLLRESRSVQVPRLGQHMELVHVVGGLGRTRPGPLHPRRIDEVDVPGELLLQTESGPKRLAHVMPADPIVVDTWIGQDGRRLTSTTEVVGAQDGLPHRVRLQPLTLDVLEYRLMHPPGAALTAGSSGRKQHQEPRIGAVRVELLPQLPPIGRELLNTRRVSRDRFEMKELFGQLSFAHTAQHK